MGTNGLEERAGVGAVIPGARGVAVGSVVNVEVGESEGDGGSVGESDAGEGDPRSAEPSGKGNTTGGDGDGPQLESASVATSTVMAATAAAMRSGCRVLRFTTTA